MMWDICIFDQNTLGNLINDCNFKIVSSGSFGKIMSKRKLASSFLCFQNITHRYLPLKILNLRKNLDKKNSNFNY